MNMAAARERRRNGGSHGPPPLKLGAKSAPLLTGRLVTARWPLEKRPSLFLRADWASRPSHSGCSPMGLVQGSHDRCGWPIPEASQGGSTVPPFVAMSAIFAAGELFALPLKRGRRRGGRGRTNTRWLKKRLRGQKSLPQWPRRQGRDPAFRPHTKWPPARRAPRGTLGGAARRGRAVGVGPAAAARAPSGERAARPAPARLPAPRRALWRTRGLPLCASAPPPWWAGGGEVAESRRVGGWAPRSFAGCGVFRRRWPPARETPFSKPAISDAGVELPAEGERPAGVGVSPPRRAARALSRGWVGQPSLTLKRNLEVRCFHFLSSPGSAWRRNSFPGQRVICMEKEGRLSWQGNQPYGC